jgi:hypothetical protein
MHLRRRWLDAVSIDFPVCEEFAVLSNRAPTGQFAFKTTAFSFGLVMPVRWSEHGVCAPRHDIAPSRQIRAREVYGSTDQEKMR